MTLGTKTAMRAVAVDRFGGPDALAVHALPVPDVGPRDVLIRVEYAGVGEWDPFEREGGYAQMLGVQPDFPYVLGSEGAGDIAAVGADVDRFSVGECVYAAGFLNPNGGFYAEYAAVDADLVAPVPRQLTTQQAGAMSGVGVTALRGLDDTLALEAGQALAIVGASGGVGHLAVQLAKRVGARVLAVASGRDGVALAERLGADVAVDGHAERVADAAHALAPEGLDAVLLTTGGAVADEAVGRVRPGGRVAYPTGVRPVPEERPNVTITGYNGEPDREIIERLNRRIGTDPFEVHVAHTFPLDEAAQAHQVLDQHYLGKICLRVTAG